MNSDSSISIAEFLNWEELARSETEKPSQHSKQPVTSSTPTEQE